MLRGSFMLAGPEAAVNGCCGSIVRLPARGDDPITPLGSCFEPGFGLGGPGVLTWLGGDVVVRVVTKVEAPIP